MRIVRVFVVAVLGLASGCLHTAYSGQTVAAKAEAPQIVSAEPTRPHRVLGRIAVEDNAGFQDMNAMVARLAEEGRKRGCDVVVCDVNNRFIDGVKSDNATGLRTWDGRPDGLVGECVTLR